MPDTEYLSAELDVWLTRLEQLHPKNIELGLERSAEVLQRLNLPRIAPKIIMLAGTNGKGSCARLLEQGLEQINKTTACYTSPHLVDFNERLRINSRTLPDLHWIQAFEQVEHARGNTELTFFEFTTLAAFCLIADHDVDVAILEIGLGGRLDAVNLLDADIAVITSIAMDHQDWLGDTIEKIAAEKLGIVKSDSIFVCGANNIPARQLQQIDCKQKLVVGQDFFWSYSAERPQSYLARTPGRLLKGKPLEQQQLSEPTGEAFEITVNNQTCNFRSAQLLPANIAISMQVLACLDPNLKLKLLIPALSNCQLAGRFQCFQKQGVEIVFDVAHNAEAAALLADRLNTLGKGRFIAVLGMLADKAIEDVIAIMSDQIDAWMVCELPGVSRAAAGKQLIELMHQQNISKVGLSKNPKQAFARAVQLAAPGDVIVVTGSFHTVGAILPKFCDAFV